MVVDILQVVEEGMEKEQGLQREAVKKFEGSDAKEDVEEAANHYGRFFAYRRVTHLRQLGKLTELWKFLHIWEYQAKREKDYANDVGDYKVVANHRGELEVIRELKEVLIQNGNVTATIKEIKTELGQNMYYIEDAYGNRFKKRGHEIKMLGVAVNKLPEGVSPVDAAIGREVLILK